MKTLLIMRHAKSSWKEEGLSDHDRPLNRRGKEAAPRMGRLLSQQGLYAPLVLSSTARRARDTAERVITAASWSSTELRLLSELYLAAPSAYLHVLREQGEPAECVLVVGHNPGVEQLVCALTEQEEAMPTGAVAKVDLAAGSWADLTSARPARLSALWRPREVA